MEEIAPGGQVIKDRDPRLIPEDPVVLKGFFSGESVIAKIVQDRQMTIVQDQTRLGQDVDARGLAWPGATLTGRLQP